MPPLERWYLLFLWNKDQMEKLINKVNDRNGPIRKLVIIHPILNANVHNNNINIENIVTTSYLRGFAYYVDQQTQVSIIYTGIGCHKVGGSLVAIKLSEDKITDLLKDIYEITQVRQIQQRKYINLLIAINDVPIDFFSVARINYNDIMQRLREIDHNDPLNIEKRPVMIFQGYINPTDFYAREVEYVDFIQGLTYIKDTTKQLITSLSSLTSRDVYILYNRDPRQGDLSYQHISGRTINPPAVDELERKLEQRIGELFLTRPKRIGLR